MTVDQFLVPFTVWLFPFSGNLIPQNVAVVTDVPKVQSKVIFTVTIHFNLNISSPSPRVQTAVLVFKKSLQVGFAASLNVNSSFISIQLTATSRRVLAVVSPGYANILDQLGFNFAGVWHPRLT